MKIAAKGVNLSEGQNEQVKSYNKAHYALTSQSDHLAGKHGDNSKEPAKPFNSALQKKKTTKTIYIKKTKKHISPVYSRKQEKYR